MTAFFAPGDPVLVAAAPGRLDVMGGIADYSGATVLQLPLARRTTVMVQQQDEPRIDVTTYRQGDWQRSSVPLGELVTGSLRSPAALKAWCSAHPDERWPAYVIGVVQWCLGAAARSAAVPPFTGLRILVATQVPEAMGVASSAALEVATMMAVAPSAGLTLVPEAMAAACQWVEHHVVGAPCGIMDQMTSACGREGMLLRLRCQPASIEGFIPVPEGYRFYGLTSGARHEIAGADYETVRTAAFMGYRIIAREIRLGDTAEATGRVRVTDPRWRGFLANMTTHELGEFENLLPVRMAGDAFLERYGGITDTVTRVRRERSYPVRAATAHPVREQARILHFASLLADPVGPDKAAELGRLMLESHRSYGACGLGSEATDRLVSLAEAAGPAAGVYGARITGGGSGGTIAVLAATEAEPRLRDIAARYSKETGRAAMLLGESGPGAAALGVRRLDAPEAHALARRITGA